MKEISNEFTTKVYHSKGKEITGNLLKITYILIIYLTYTSSYS